MVDLGKHLRENLSEAKKLTELLFTVDLGHIILEPFGIGQLKHDWAVERVVFGDSPQEIDWKHPAEGPFDKFCYALNYSVIRPVQLARYAKRKFVPRLGFNPDNTPLARATTSIHNAYLEYAPWFVTSNEDGRFADHVMYHELGHILAYRLAQRNDLLDPFVRCDSDYISEGFPEFFSMIVQGSLHPNKTPHIGYVDELSEFHDKFLEGEDIGTPADIERILCQAITLESIMQVFQEDHD